MDINFFFKGLAIGFLIALPVGPIAILCIHRTLTAGKIHGLVSGLGAATADAVYGFIAVFGVGFVADFLVEQQMLFRIIGAAFFCGLGVRTFLSKTAKEAGSGNNFSHVSNYGSAFLLTLMNPMTIFAFVAIFSVLGIASPHYVSAGLLVGGVFMGSGFWWLALSGTVDIFREKFSHSNLVWLNRISGTIITTFGLLMLLNLKG